MGYRRTQRDRIRFGPSSASGPSADVFAASVFCQRWEHAVTHAVTTFYVLALSPQHAVELGQIRVQKMGGAEHVELSSNERMDGLGWPFTEMVLEAESQDEKDSRAAAYHAMSQRRVCVECGEPWNGVRRACSCDAPPNIPVTKAEADAAVLGAR